MFGIDSPELLVIAVVALVVIGPKELPGLLRTWGKWMAQMRGMAAEFRGHVDEMVRQSELDDVKKQLETTHGLDLKSLDPTQQIKSHIQEGMAEGREGAGRGQERLRQSAGRARIGAPDRRRAGSRTHAGDRRRAGARGRAGACRRRGRAVAACGTAAACRAGEASQGRGCGLSPISALN